MKSYGDGVKSYGDGVKSYGDGVKSYGDGVKSYGDGVKSYGDGTAVLSLICSGGLQGMWINHHTMQASNFVNLKDSFLINTKSFITPSLPNIHS